MRPRQQSPFHWGMNQPHRQQMPFQWGSGPRRQQMPSYLRMQPQRSMGPMPFSPPHPMMGMPQQSRQGGGLLAKILGNRKTAPNGFLGVNPGNMGAAGNKGSILKSLGNPSGISTFLSNTQQVLQAAQQIAPMVQQYGPLVRNIPAIWKLYRGLKDTTAEIEDTEEIEETENTEDNEESTVDLQQDTIESSEQDMGNINAIRIKADSKKSHNPNHIGRSKPKLYI